MWMRRLDWLRRFLESTNVDAETVSTEAAALARAHEELREQHRAVLERLEATSLQVSRLQQEREKLKTRYEHLRAEFARLRSTDGRVHSADLDNGSDDGLDSSANEKTVSPDRQQPPNGTSVASYYGVLWQKRRRSKLVACCPVCRKPLDVLFPRSQEDRLHFCASCGFVAVELIGVPLAVVKRTLKRRFSTDRAADRDGTNLLNGVSPSPASSTDQG